MIYLFKREYSQVFVLEVNKWVIFIHFRLCFATATHNFKWMKITHLFKLSNLTLQAPLCCSAELFVFILHSFKPRPLSNWTILFTPHYFIHFSGFSYDLNLPSSISRVHNRSYLRAVACLYLSQHIYLICITFNPCPAELLQLYFSSFEAGIANAISSFKWRKILLFMKNRHF